MPRRVGQSVEIDPSATLADEFCCDAQQGVRSDMIASAHSHSVTVNTVDDADLSSGCVSLSSVVTDP